MDERERDKFYSSTPDDDDSGEYELEPPDAEVLAGAERRAKEVVEATHASIDIDEIYRDADRDRGSEILHDWSTNFRFQFQVKHLLIATAVAAIILTLIKWQVFGTVAVMLVMLSIAGLYLYLQWQEKKAQDEADRRRHEMYAKRRAYMQKMMGESPPDDAGEAVATSHSARGKSVRPSKIDETWQEVRDRERFQFRFSVSEMMVAMTTAAVILGLIRLFGGPEYVATLLGFIAIGGLAAHMFGFEPPQTVILGWWLILVLYVILSIVSAVWTSLA